MTRAAQPASSAKPVLSIVAAVLVGMVIGVGAFGVGYSEMPSYLSTDPRNCTNCHVMRPEYDAWAKGAHKNVATCDDCHLPHGSIVNKLLVQAQDGVLHGYKFTTRTYPTNIVIRQSSLDVVNGSCLHCHDTLTATLHVTRGSETITCTHCHANVGHDN